ncbi:MAG TPA: zinc-binding dehydrogenase [Cyclobacteriaceae bacterium]|nr:zinc-binding dehydrogenase [Cyclobacteriaceae bacterium]
MNTSHAPLVTAQTRTSTTSYQTAVIDRPQSIAYIEQAKSFGPDQLWVRLEGVGLCASNIPVWEGREWFQYPLDPGTPGHEGWGIVEDFGDQVTGFHVGQRVAILQGNAFSEYLAVSAENAVVLPPELEGMPFPGEPLGCLMNIFKRADIQAGQTVAVIGLGFLGLGLIKLCKEKGAKVVALSRRDSSLQIASGDADMCLKMDDHYQIVERVQHYTEGRGCERVIECTGKQWPLDLATDIIGDYGKLIIAGYHQDGLRNVNLQKWNWKALDVINAHERDPNRYKEGIIAAIEATQKGVIHPRELLSHEFTFDQLSEAMAMLSACPEGFIKGYIKFI